MFQLTWTMSNNQVRTNTVYLKVLFPLVLKYILTLENILQ